MVSAKYKFCPSCKLRNWADAIICEYCGTPFNSSYEKYSTTQDVDGETKFLLSNLEKKIENVTMEAPAEGIAIFTLSQTYPIEIRLENEFIIGRLTKAIEETIVDLTPYDAYALGVSKRHLKVQRARGEYEVMDLGSTNGTWVNEQRLLPQQPLTITSGSQIRLGKMLIFVSFRPKSSKG